MVSEPKVRPPSVGTDRHQTALKRKAKHAEEERDAVKSELSRTKAKVQRLLRHRSLLAERLAHYEEMLDGYDSESVVGTDASESELSDDEWASTQFEVPSPGDSRADAPQKGGASSSSRPSGPRKSTAVVRKPPRKVQYVPHGPDGRPLLPLKIGVLTLVNLGKVLYDNPNFHSTRYIWPLGYEAIRQYQSTKHPNKMSNYRCSIVEHEGFPRFLIIPEDDPDNPIISSTATGAWTTVLKLANKVRNRDSSNSASGPDYFGFSHPTIAKLIQDLPGADKCATYVWQDYIMPDAPPAPSKRARNRSTASSSQRPPTSTQDFNDTQDGALDTQDLIDEDEDLDDDDAMSTDLNVVED